MSTKKRVGQWLGTITVNSSLARYLFGIAVQFSDNIPLAIQQAMSDFFINTAIECRLVPLSFVTHHRLGMATFDERTSFYPLATVGQTHPKNI
jgi:hypothetical protein